MTDAPDPYKILQVDPEAEDEVIQAAYRRLAQKYHPDRSTGQEAIDRMVAINAAWETIGDPKRRASFDLARRAAAAAQQTPTRPTSGVPGASARWPSSPARSSRRRALPIRGSLDPPSRDPPKPCRGTGRRAARRLAADTTRRRCALPRGLPLQARRRAIRRVASSTSGATRAGRSVRSAEPISSTSSGSIGCPSVGRIGTRSTGSCDGPDAARVRRPTPGLFRRR